MSKKLFGGLLAAVFLIAGSTGLPAEEIEKL